MAQARSRWCAILLAARSRMELDNYIRHIPGFPKEGILFHDIMPLLQNAEALHYTVDKLADFARKREVDLVLGAEARGFILGAAMAYALRVGFAAARKPGKLPWTVSRCEYDLEYGTDALEIHADAIKPGQRVLIHDDLLATGGTAKAKIELVEQAGGVVAGLAFLIELTELHGREKLEGYELFSLLQYDV
jgi:adenine phosphoribosyltransferase